MIIINKNIIVVILLTILLSNYVGCIDDNSNSEPSSIQVPLSSVILLENELRNVEKVNEQITNESYIATNLTGNNLTWNITEGYFASFASNTSRIMESLIRLESTQIARENVNFYKSFLLNEQFTEQPIETIGDQSFLLHTTMIIKENETDAYQLVFSIRDVVVSLQGFGITKENMIFYATTINNILLNEKLY